MRIFVPVPLRVVPSSAVRRPRSVQWGIASKRGPLRRFRRFIESSNWIERNFFGKWIDGACVGVIIVSVLYFLPILMSLLLD